MESPLRLDTIPLVQQGFNRSLFYGEGLFETILYRGITKRLRRHYNRLKTSADFFEIPCPSFEEFVSEIESVAQSDRGIYVKYCLFSSGENLYYKTPDSYSCLVIKAKAPEVPDNVNLTYSPYRRHSENPIIRHKSTNYLFNILNKRWAIKRGFYDAIILNQDGLVTECSASNLLVKIDRDHYVTPSKDSGLLWGITLSVLCDSITIKQEAVTPKTLKEAQAVYILNSLIGAAPVSSIDDHSYDIDREETERLRELLNGDDS